MTPDQVKSLVDVGEKIATALDDPWVLFWTIIGAFGAAASGVGALIAAIASLHSARLAQRALIGAQMPVLYIDAFLGSEYSDGVAKINIRFKNFGAGIAKDIEYFIDGKRVPTTHTFALPSGNVGSGENILAFPQPPNISRVPMELRYKDASGNLHATQQQMKWLDGKYQFDDSVFIVS